MRKSLSHTAVIASLLVAVAGCDSTPTPDEPDAAATSASSAPAPSAPSTPSDLTEEEQMLVDMVSADGSVKVIAQVVTDGETEAADRLATLTAGLEEYGVTDTDTGSTWLAATVTADALNFLLASPDVDRVSEDGVMKPA